MGKRKTKKTLTKIDPSILKLGLHAVSQYAAGDGARVTTTVKPSRQLPAILEDLPDFSANTSGFNEPTEGNDTEDDVSRGYYVARVCDFSFFSAFQTPGLTVARITHSCCGRLNATFTSTSS
jgi:hypothetical protein